MTAFGCSEAPSTSQARSVIAETSTSTEGEPENQFGFYEAMDTGPDPFGEDAPSAKSMVVDINKPDESDPETDDVSEQPASGEQIAYSYGFGFQIDNDEIAELQTAHIALCDEMGRICRILKTSIANSESWDGYGQITLQVASDEAGAFQELLKQTADEFDGELISAVRNGEDLSSNIIDTEARLQSRLILREKLTAILQNRGGSVDELVKAEQAVADVNEEIDATRSKLEKYRGRIQYSDVTIDYEPNYGQSQLGFSRPVMTALGSIGTTLGMTVAVIVYALTALIPIALLIIALRWLLHRFGLRFRFWRKDPG